MTSHAFRSAERKRRSADRSRGPRFATKRETDDLRDLVRRTDVEPPRVVFREDVAGARRTLQEHLQHMREPTLGEM